MDRGFRESMKVQDLIQRTKQISKKTQDNIPQSSYWIWVDEYKPCEDNM